MRRQYTRAFTAPRLGADLVAAFPQLQVVPASGLPSVLYMLESDQANQFWLTVPDTAGISAEALDAVVAAHDSTTPWPADVQAAADTTSLDDLAAQYAAALTQIDNDRTQVASGVTNLADAAWTPLTATQKAERLRTVLQGVLAVLDNDLAREARELKALRVLLRRQGD